MIMFKHSTNCATAPKPMKKDHAVNRKQKASPAFPPLEAETRPAVATAQAAFYLCRAPRTLRLWAAAGEASPIKPLRVNRRLAWPVDDIKRALGVA